MYVLGLFSRSLLYVLGLFSRSLLYVLGLLSRSLLYVLGLNAQSMCVSTNEQNTLSHIHTHAHIYTCLRILYYNSLTSSKEFFTSSSKAARRRNKAQAFATNVISLQSKLVDQK